MDNSILTQLEDDLLDDIIIQTTIQHLQSRRRVPRPMRTGLPGGVYIQELLDSDNQERIKQVLRMTKPTFFALRDWLVNHTELTERRYDCGRKASYLFTYYESPCLK